MREDITIALLLRDDRFEEAKEYCKIVYKEILSLPLVVREDIIEFTKSQAAQQSAQADAADCICGYDPKTGYRTDIVCPVHDTPRR